MIVVTSFPTCVFLSFPQNYFLIASTARAFDLYLGKKILTLRPMAQPQKIIERRCGETRVIVVRVGGERAERAHFPASGRGQKRFRRSTKQQRESGNRKTTSPRSVRCVMREKLRARQPRGTCVLRKFLRRPPRSTLSPSRKSRGWTGHYCTRRQLKRVRIAISIFIRKRTLCGKRFNS